MRDFYQTYQIRQTPSDEFNLSWSHYLFLMRIDNPEERKFYEIGKLTHQDLGQMQMYVNYYDRFVKLEHEKKTIGIVLCKNKNDSLVEITLPENNTQISASKYQTVLPDKNELIKLLEEK